MKNQQNGDQFQRWLNAAPDGRRTKGDSRVELILIKMFLPFMKASGVTLRWTGRFFSNDLDNPFAWDPIEPVNYANRPTLVFVTEMETVLWETVRHAWGVLHDDGTEPGRGTWNYIEKAVRNRLITARARYIKHAEKYDAKVLSTDWDFGVGDDLEDRAQAELLEGAEDTADVARAMSGLTSREAVVLRMRAMHDLTFEEIGTELKMNKSTAKRIYDKALEKAKEALR